MTKRSASGFKSLSLAIGQTLHSTGVLGVVLRSHVAFPSKIIFLFFGKDCHWLIVICYAILLSAGWAVFITRVYPIDRVVFVNARIGDALVT
jgi:hypothetical protein